MIPYKKTEEEIRALAPQIYAYRKILHQHPECAWQEHWTTAYLKEELQALGYKIHEGEEVAGHDTGLIAELALGSEPCVALRFDIDGLPVTESTSPGHIPTREGFASQALGRMHACGHDGHMAIGLGCAHYFAKHKKELKGTLRLIFQPAEEGARGAREVVAQGWLDDVDYLLGGHIVDTDYDPLGANVITHVTSSLATYKCDILFHGKSAHAARPEEGHNCIHAISDFIMATKDLPGDGFIHVGKIASGSTRNIIADYGEMAVETRAHSTKRNEELVALLDHHLEKSTKKYGVTYEKIGMGSAPSLACHLPLANRLDALYGSCSLLRPSSLKDVAFRASEDVAHMQARVLEKGGATVFFLFPTPLAADLHQHNFDFPMETLLTGLCAYVLAVLDLMK